MKFITLINPGYIPYCINFLKSMEKAGCKWPLYAYCTDFTSMYPALQSYFGVLCLDAKSFLRKSLSNDITLYDTLEYKDIVFAKLDAIRYSLSVFKDVVVYLDTDAVLLKDPKFYLKNLVKTVAANVFCQCDEGASECTNVNDCPSVGTGIIMACPVQKVIDLCRYENDDVKRFPSDQHYLEWRMTQDSINFQTMPKRFFPNGCVRHKFFESAYWVHYNWMIGNEKKLAMEKDGVWDNMEQ
jgi:hypothetical protein